MTIIEKPSYIGVYVCSTFIVTCSLFALLFLRHLPYVSLGFLALALLFLVGTLGIYREMRYTRNYVPYTTDHQFPDDHLTQVGQKLNEVCEGTPYKLFCNDHGFRLGRDLADANFWSAFHYNNIQEVYRVSLIYKGNKKWTYLQEMVSFDFSAGPGTVKLKAESTAGTTKSFSKQAAFSFKVKDRKIVVDKVVDYTFSTDEIDVPAKAAIRSQGGRLVLPVVSKIGLTMGIIGAATAGGVLLYLKG